MQLMWPINHSYPLPNLRGKGKNSINTITCMIKSLLGTPPTLVENEHKLLEKINILCLMEIIFSRPSEDRTIPLNVIADSTKLSIEDVEHLIMKSLSVPLGYCNVWRKLAVLWTVELCQSRF
ncbi:26S proteasome non-ATPase regulatory subunit 13 homolog B-like isoform X2 [Euphorbia lathyris]|uniref:26S proteasome non-ATPase regulatory subunit 13 homolog B-like isoform X2 n=1 Tax=Euphorbia lathyris TaxID=212925 RepID=UPI003313887B